MIDFIENINSQGYLALFIIITLGIIIGKIKIKGFSFDISAVIFVALLLGHLGFVVPHIFLNFGILLFIFMVGIQAGPGFFSAFKAYGRQLILTTTILIITAAGISYLLIKIFNIDLNLGIGLYTGALTSTPGLAAAIEATNSPAAPVGYGIAYTFGVVGVILLMNFLPKIFKIDMKKEEDLFNESLKKDYPTIKGETLIVENENIFGKSLKELSINSMTGARISRIKHGDFTKTPNSETVLNKGDIVRIVGTEEAISKAQLLIGETTDKDISLASGYEIDWILVTNKDVVNKNYQEIALSEIYDATVLKIKRSGIEISPRPTSTFRFGDRLQVASDKTNMNKVKKLLGNDNKKLSSTDFLPIVLGILLGILLGNFAFPVAGIEFKLGITGGTLAVGIILSRMGKTGPIIWSMSGSANHLLRELGLLLFLATIGTEAGLHLAETINEQGVILLFIGMLVTIIPVFVGAFFGKYVFKMNFLSLLGVITGAMTSTPGLAVVNSKSDTNAAPIAYAAVYPVALVLVIITTQIMAVLS